MRMSGNVAIASQENQAPLFSSSGMIVQARRRRVSESCSRRTRGAETVRSQKKSAGFVK